VTVRFGGVAVFVHEIEAIAELLVRAEATAQVDLLAEHSRRLIADREAAVRVVGRTLEHIVDDAARVAEAVHETRKSLEHFDLLELFE
jgi:hypothetical protein